jgi:FlaG/FlaF family flagellin (archaellin)
LHKRRWNRKGVEVILAALLLVVIVAVMAAIVYSWSLGFFGSVLPTPAKGSDNLVLENQGFNVANNNVTLYLRNIGTAVTTLVSYYVKDMNGNQCAKASGWSKGPYSPTQLAIVTLGIPSPPSTYCTWTGTPFTFQQGNVYTVTVVTFHNNQFSFTIQR